MLDRIPVKPPAGKRKPPRRSLSACVEQHTYDWVLEEAKARNMGPAEFLREILERLQSGDF